MIRIASFDYTQLPIKDFAQIPKRLRSATNKIRLTIYKLHLAITDKNNMWFLSVVEGPQDLENPTFLLVCAREGGIFFIIKISIYLLMN